MDAPGRLGHAAAVRPALPLAVVLVVAACQRGKDSPPSPGSAPPAPAAAQPPGAAVVAMLTRAETEDLCNAYERSGAAADIEDNRDYLVADYLGKHITSDTGHAWLINFARLGADKAARAAALERAARDAGLPGCPLADRWR